MPLFDLSRVTTTLADLLSRNINLRLDPGLAPGVTVSALPPERVANGQNQLNLYLYHIAEDPHYRNLPGNMADRVQVATKPMALVLYYILTAHHRLDNEFDSLREQRLMGHALKTFHDTPVITDRTAIAGVRVLPEELRGRDNAIQVTLRQIPPEEAPNFWSAEEFQTARLAAYYEVRTVMLLPEQPQSIPGIVTTLNVFVADAAGTRIDSTHSAVPITLPAAQGGLASLIETTPARVGPPIPALPDSNRLTLRGTSLASGADPRLTLRTARWEREEPPRLHMPLDPALNPGTAVALAADRVTATLPATLRVALQGGGTVDLPLFPGSYAIALESARTTLNSDGVPATLRTRSNEAGLAILPRIEGAVRDPVTGHIAVTIAGSFALDVGRAFGDPLPELEIAIGLNGNAYQPQEGAGPPAAGAFTIAPHTLTIAPFPDVIVPGTYALRVIVDGADSQPFWLELA